jgi:hypothetical protein
LSGSSGKSTTTSYALFREKDIYFLLFSSLWGSPFVPGAIYVFGMFDVISFYFG